MQATSLSKSEEQLMEIIWTQEQVIMGDIIQSYPDPVPAPTTIATLLKRMREKGFVAYLTVGNFRQYYPLVKKSDYFANQLNRKKKSFFSDSAFQFASFFTRGTNLTATEL